MTCEQENQLNQDCKPQAVHENPTDTDAHVRQDVSSEHAYFPSALSVETWARFISMTSVHGHSSSASTTHHSRCCPSDRGPAPTFCHVTTATFLV